MTKDKRDIERLKDELANTQKVEAWQHAEAEKYSRQAEALQVQLDAAAEVLQGQLRVSDKLYSLIREIVPMLGTMWVEDYDSYNAWREKAKTLLVKNGKWNND